MDPLEIFCCRPADRLVETARGLFNILDSQLELLNSLVALAGILRALFGGLSKLLDLLFASDDIGLELAVILFRLCELFIELFLAEALVAGAGICRGVTL